MLSYASQQCFLPGHFNEGIIDDTWPGIQCGQVGYYRGEEAVHEDGLRYVAVDNNFLNGHIGSI